MIQINDFVLNESRRKIFTKNAEELVGAGLANLVIESIPKIDESDVAFFKSETFLDQAKNDVKKIISQNTDFEFKSAVSLEEIDLYDTVGLYKTIVNNVKYHLRDATNVAIEEMQMISNNIDEFKKLVDDYTVSEEVIKDIETANMALLGFSFGLEEGEGIKQEETLPSDSDDNITSADEDVAEVKEFETNTDIEDTSTKEGIGPNVVNAIRKEVTDQLIAAKTKQGIVEKVIAEVHKATVDAGKKIEEELIKPEEPKPEEKPEDKKEGEKPEGDEKGSGDEKGGDNEKGVDVTSPDDDIGSDTPAPEDDKKEGDEPKAEEPSAPENEEPAKEEPAKEEPAKEGDEKKEPEDEKESKESFDIGLRKDLVIPTTIDPNTSINSITMKATPNLSLENLIPLAPVGISDKVKPDHFTKMALSDFNNKSVMENRFNLLETSLKSDTVDESDKRKIKELSQKLKTGLETYNFVTNKLMGTGVSVDKVTLNKNEKPIRSFITKVLLGKGISTEFENISTENYFDFIIDTALLKNSILGIENAQSALPIHELIYKRTNELNEFKKNSEAISNEEITAITNFGTLVSSVSGISNLFDTNSVIKSFNDQIKDKFEKDKTSQIDKKALSESLVSRLPKDSSMESLAEEELKFIVDSTINNKQLINPNTTIFETLCFKIGEESIRAGEEVNPLAIRRKLNYYSTLLIGLEHIEAITKKDVKNFSAKLNFGVLL